jgi:hypothetical protein
VTAPGALHIAGPPCMVVDHAKQDVGSGLGLIAGPLLFIHVSFF